MVALSGLETREMLERLDSPVRFGHAQIWSRFPPSLPFCHHRVQIIEPFRTRITMEDVEMKARNE